MKDRIIVISGASDGIGSSLADHFSNSATVIGLSRRGSGPSGVKNISCDIRSADSVNAAIDEIVSTYKKIDVLINNAAVLKSAPLVLTSIEDIKNMIDTNLLGTILLTRAAMRTMLAQKRGRVVNIISMSHRLKKPGDAVYAANKAAVEIFAQILNQEVHGSGITVNNVAVSAMSTGMLAPLVKNDENKIKKIIPHGDYATTKSIAYGIETFLSEEANDYGGQTLYLGGIAP